MGYSTHGAQQDMGYSTHGAQQNTGYSTCSPNESLACVGYHKSSLHHDMLQSPVTDPWHVLHEDWEETVLLVTAIVLHNALVVQVLEQLNLTLQGFHLLGANAQ